MTKPLYIIEKLATRLGLVVLIALYALVFGTIILTLNQLTEVTGGIGILDFDRGYDKARVMEVYDSYGVPGFALSGRILVLDIFNPALYSLILAALTFLTWKPRGHAWLSLVALLGGIGDYLENITLFLMARAYPDIPNGLVELSSTLSLIKNTLLPISIAPLLVGLLLWLWSYVTRKAG
jgi:hypothetical protein